jgi:hypothetical protein
MSGMAKVVVSNLVPSKQKETDTTESWGSHGKSGKLKEFDEQDSTQDKEDRARGEKSIRNHQ